MRLYRILSLALIFSFLSINPAVIYSYDKTLIDNYFRQGKFDQAIKYLNKEIRESPDDYNICYKLAEAYRKKRDFTQAIIRFKEAIRINPGSSGGYVGLARVYENMDEYPQSISYYKEALKINPKDSTAYDGLGTVYYLADEFELSIECHKKAIEINPRNLYAYYGLGDSYRKLGRFKDAIAAFDQAVTLVPDDSRGYDGKALVYFDMCDYDNAIKWYGEALSRSADNTNVYYGLGRVYEALGNYGEAEKYQKKSIRINPGEFRSYEGLGNICRKQHRYKEAKRWYEKSIEKCPPRRFILCPHEGLGLTYLKLEEPRRAEEVFLSMVKLKPRNPLGYHDLAKYYFYTGKFDLAAGNIDKALTLVENPADKRQDLQLKAFILIMQNKSAQAKNILTDLAKENNPDRAIISGQGHIAFMEKDYPAAGKYFEEAMKHRDLCVPDRGPIEGELTVYLGLARLCAAEGDYKEAIKYYQMILKDEPIAVFALAELGDVYTKLGEKAKADIYYKRARAVNPEYKI